ncbi:MAG: hypothetical protein HQM01_06850 [Magnetococcales bacterium]|nr:hypothetical protein [Magnetococcales bacterium]
MSGGAGADKFLFDYYNLQSLGYPIYKYVLVGANDPNYHGDRILDFQAGDQLDFTNLLYHYGYSSAGTNPFGDGWLNAVQVGNDLEIRLGANAHVDGYSDLIVTLENTPLDLLINGVLPGGLQMTFTQTSDSNHLMGNPFDTTYLWDQSDGTFGGKDAIVDEGGQDHLLFGHLHDVAIRFAQASTDTIGDGPLSVEIVHEVVDTLSGNVNLTFDLLDSHIDLARDIEHVAATDGVLTSTSATQVELHTLLEGTDTAAIDATHAAYIAAGNAQNNQIDLSGLSDAARALVFGGDGNDHLVGTSGHDELIGGNGTDTLTGGAGQDILTGGEGVDRFEFANVGEGSLTFAQADTITDFTPLQDKIWLGGGFTSQEGYVEISYSANSLAQLQTAMESGVLDTLAKDAGVAEGTNYFAFLSFTDKDGGTDSGNYLVYDTDAASSGNMTVLAELEQLNANHFSHADLIQPV